MPEASEIGRLRARVSRLEADVERLSAVLDNVTDIIALLKPVPFVEYVNSSIERVLGYKPADLFGKDLLSLMHPADRPVMEGALRVRGEKQGDVRPLECRAIHKDGSERTIESVFSVLAGNERGLTVIARDVTNRNAIEAQIVQAERMNAISRLAGGVAHDFNNILTVVSGYAELLSSRLEGQAILQGFAGQISKAADRAATLTGQLLSFSRRHVIHPDVLNLNDLVTSLHAALTAASGPRVELRLVLDEGLGNMKADRAQMEQILVSLVSNARASMPGGGCAEIETSMVPRGESAGHPSEESLGRFVRVAVHDNGVGIDEFARTHAFEPFTTGKHNAGGAGLALAAVFGAVKQNGGDIRVLSAPERGTTFEIVFPEHLDFKSERSGALNPLAVGGHETILLVEDDPGVRHLSLEILSDCGYKMLEAEDADEALRIHESHKGKIDLLVTDVVMPRMNGRELAQLVSTRSPQTKVLYVSAYTDDVMLRFGVLVSEVHFLQKPFTAPQLAGRVRQILDGES